MTCSLRLHEIAVAAMPVTAIDLDDLPTAELAPFAGLIQAGRSDQGLLAAMQGKLRGFLDKGRVVVFSGQLTHDWLPGATAFEPGPASGAEPGPPQLGNHPIFASVSPKDLGSNFLYSNGQHRPPTTADIIAEHADGTPRAYLDRTSTAGTTLVSTIDPLAHFGHTGAANAAGFLDELLLWVTTALPRRGDGS